MCSRANSLSTVSAAGKKCFSQSASAEAEAAADFAADFAALRISEAGVSAKPRGEELEDEGGLTRKLVRLRAREPRRVRARNKMRQAVAQRS